MPDGRAIGSRGILGIPSDGMLCSARELGLGERSQWHPRAAARTRPSACRTAKSPVSIDDVIFDVDVTRNRPDAFGHVGVARDLAAKLRLPFTPPQPTLPSSGGPADADRRHRRRGAMRPVHAHRALRHHRRPERTVDGGSAAAVGQRPINNVVDVSNYVMLELNQPNHAYDLATLGGRRDPCPRSPPTVRS